MPRTKGRFREPEFWSEERGALLETGTPVHSLAPHHESEWWYNWPGIVTSVLLDGKVLVEFMGFGASVTRTVELPRTDLTVIKDASIVARLYRVRKRLSLARQRTGQPK